MILVRYFAGARAAAGCAEEKVEAATLAGVIAAVSQRHGDRLAAVLTASSFLVDEVVCHRRGAVLPPGATVDVLPPFAGG
jgi:molybdopterin synthase sulfur carrier subunit